MRQFHLRRAQTTGWHGGPSWCHDQSIHRPGDSGASANVIGLEELPEGVEPTGPVGKPFKDARDGDIKMFGKCDLLMKNGNAKVGGRWAACQVIRPLQSVGATAGPEDGPGEQDVFFNNRLGVVMPPGIVDMILKRIKPVATYPRRSGLYVFDYELSSFPRQGQAQQTRGLSLLAHS